jgi:hypothetical protein
MEHDLITDSWDILCVAMILVTLLHPHRHRGVPLIVVTIELHSAVTNKSHVAREARDRQRWNGLPHLVPL